MKTLAACLLLLAAVASCPAADAIRSGVLWFDAEGGVVSAHGAGVLKEGDRYYLFGEFKRDGGNEFNGFSCYSSDDLVHWRFERIALPVQPDGRLGPGRVGERPKVMKCPATGEFVMYMHTDAGDYRDPAVGYATSDTIDGEYTFRGVLPYQGGRIKKWDMGVFQDDDGAGYVVTHSGNLYRLSDDYKRVEHAVVEGMTHGCESPALFKRDGLYYWLGSGLTGWERNDNEYFTATDLAGPWTPRGRFAPEGKLTWNSQTTFVLPVAGSEATTYVFMGDRWAHPRQRSAATYVWQPLRFDEEGGLSLPEYLPAWRLDTATGEWSPSEPDAGVVAIGEVDGVKHSDDWSPHTDASGFTDLRSATKGATLSVPFHGTRVGLVSVARPDGGFGRVEILGPDGRVLHSNIVETYCRYEESSLKYLSPELPPGDYELRVTVLGEHFFWQGKRASHGSQGDYVSVRGVLVEE